MVVGVIFDYDIILIEFRDWIKVFEEGLVCKLGNVDCGYMYGIFIW